MIDAQLGDAFGDGLSQLFYDCGVDGGCCEIANELVDASAGGVLVGGDTSSIGVCGGHL